MPYSETERDAIKEAVLKLASGTRAVRITTTDATAQLSAIDAGSEDFHNKRREILFELAAFIEGGR